MANIKAVGDLMKRKKSDEDKRMEAWERNQKRVQTEQRSGPKGSGGGKGTMEMLSTMFRMGSGRLGKNRSDEDKKLNRK